MNKIQVILCGGVGKRLWPLSRTSYPKPFIPLPSTQSTNTITLFSETVRRSKNIIDSFITVTHQDYLSLVQGSFDNKDINTTLLEPCRKNTAPSIALAALHANPDDILFVTPSDHWIANEEQYTTEVHAATETAKQDKLVTFGISPRTPETGYGYIQKSNMIKGDSIPIFNVASFKEKPDLQTAEIYLESGNYLWNSGMFCFKASTFLNELKTYQPELYEGLKAVQKSAKNKNKTMHYALKEMEKLQSISIDYALMEKSNNVVVLESKLDWHDLGSFEQLQTLYPQDENKNTKSKKILSVNSQNNVIVPGNRHITTIGINDLVIVDTEDALLISKKDASNEIQTVVDTLKEDKPELVDAPLLEIRPWGSFKVINKGVGFKVKEITVLPGKRLSLQKHKYRSEHWVVASGIAIVTINDTIKPVHLEESVTIPKGAVHRMENGANEILKIIEVQYGDYLGEDDIIRIEDDFNRS